MQCKYFFFTHLYYPNIIAPIFFSDIQIACHPLYTAHNWTGRKKRTFVLSRSTPTMRIEIDKIVTTMSWSLRHMSRNYLATEIQLGQRLEVAVVAMGAGCGRRTLRRWHPLAPQVKLTRTL